MINAVRVLWKTVKDIWEDMLLLVLMNVLTIVCGLLFFAAVILPPYLALVSTTSLVFSLLIALVLMIPTSIPFAGALYGLYAVCNRVANGFAISWEYYFTAFKQNIWKAWKYFIFATAVGILIALNFFWYPQAFPQGEWVPWVMGAWLAAGLFWMAIQFYVFPFYIEQETKSWRVALRNAALIAGANPLFTLVLLIVAVAFLALSLLVVPPLFVLLGLLLWVMPGTQAVINRIEAYRKKLEADANKGKPKTTR
jgi:hypothetical protein